jgi:tyrosyl-tRNA synthetase
MIKIITDEKKIDEITNRGVENVYPNKDVFKKTLMSGKKIRLYYGIDPTGSTLHLGHLVQLLKLRKFQDLGHEVIILIGDFTAQIGDPTDKQAARKSLSHQQVLKNAKGYKKQISKILNLKKSNVRFVHNEKWTNKLTPEDMLELASHFTVSNLLARSMFQERIKAGREVYVHEFLYPIFQAYDAVTMDVDLQVGGNDQMFNMLAGRDLMKKKKNKEMFVLTTKLLIDPAGKKMGKTENNMVALSDNEEEMYGKIMSWSDDLIMPGLELCTNMPTFEIEKIATQLAEGMNPRDLKMRLAREITAIYHGEKKAKEAGENWNNVFSKKEIPTDIENISVKNGALLVEVLVNKKIISSKSDFRRLVDEHAITNLNTNEKISSYTANAEAGVYRIGKKRFCKISLEN